MGHQPQWEETWGIHSTHKPFSDKNLPEDKMQTVKGAVREQRPGGTVVRGPVVNAAAM